MKRLLPVFIFICALLAACGPPTRQITPQLVNAYITPAADPWVGELYNCASASAVINLSTQQSADIVIRIGVPDHLTVPSYQISTEEILVIVQPQTGVASLTLEQVRSIFLGQVVNWQAVGGTDLPVQVWSFSPDVDVEEIFSREVMDGQPITSTARLALSGESLAVAVHTHPGSVGILPRRLITEGVHGVFTVAQVPVLAIIRTPPVGVIKGLISCLQQESH